ncbi:MAG: hypothetical protein J5J00_13635, partial [Deltaproteobacteria bacterium]|nr:hypothetical protein [Deltaproteobacteria bacterium]
MLRRKLPRTSLGSGGRLEVECNFDEKLGRSRDPSTRFARSGQDLRLALLAQGRTFDSLPSMRARCALTRDRSLAQGRTFDSLPSM